MIAKDTNFPSCCAAGVDKAVLFLYVTGVIAVALAEKKKWSTTFVNKPSLILFYSFSNLFQPQVRNRHGRKAPGETSAVTDERLSALSQTGFEGEFIRF